MIDLIDPRGIVIAIGNQYVHSVLYLLWILACAHEL